MSYLPGNPPDTIVTGNITTSTPGAGNTVQMQLIGHKSCSVLVAGTWAGILYAESSPDNGTTWFAVQVLDSSITSSEQSVNSINANGIYSIFGFTGTTYYRIRATTDTAWSGSAGITLTANEMESIGENVATSVSQNVIVSAENSSTNNLAAGVSFIGTSRSTLGAHVLQVSLHTDQNCTISVDQSPGLLTLPGTVTTNGSTTLSGSSTLFQTGSRPVKHGDEILVSGESVRIVDTVSSDTSLTVTVAFSTSVGSLSYQAYSWDVTDTYAYNKILNNFSITVQSVSSFFRTRITNSTTLNSTTYLRAQSNLCPIGEPLPRSLNTLGNLKVEINGLRDNFGFQGEFTPMRDLKECQPYRLTGASFPTSGNDSNFWTPINGNSAPAVTVANIATMQSGTANNGYAQIQTVRLSRFIFAHPHDYRALIRVSTVVVANNTRTWGPVSTSGSPATTLLDGPYFQLSASGVLSVNTINNGGTPVSISSGSFNGAVSEYIVDTNVHQYEIVYYVASASFYIDNVLIHTVVPTTAPLFNNLTLPITAQTKNSAGGTANGVLEMWASIILRLGRSETSPKSYYQHGAQAGVALKIGSGKLQKIVVNSYVSGSTVSVYDSATSATGTIALIAPSVGTFAATPPVSVIYDLDFYNGLWLVTANAATDVTVIYE